MKNNKLILFCSLLVLVTLSGCSEEKESDVPKTKIVSNQENKTMESQIQMLHFVDAHGQWFDAEIDPNVKKHGFDWQYLKNNGKSLTYDGDDSYTIQKGIDVSKYQGNINWKAVKEDGYEFAIIRIGFRGYGKSGAIKLDDRYRQYIKDAKSAGLEVGVYFFSQAINEKEAEEEAEFVIDNLNGIKLELPITYDPELIKNDEARTDNVSGEQFTKNAIAFCEKIKQAGYEPMIYSNMYWEAFLFDMEKIDDYRIWYADYELKPQTPYVFEYWQYTESGDVNGITGGCDIDVRFVR